MTPCFSSGVLLYQPSDGQIQLDGQLNHDTVWLTQAQMTELFQISRKTVSEHIGNVFREGALDKAAVVQKSRTTAADGKAYRTKYYNLDVIISVGYRVKSRCGTSFRQWATQVLRQYLVQGYVLFGWEKDRSFESSVRTIYQRFGGQDMYPSVEEEGANLLYFVVKNHSFSTAISGLRRFYSCTFWTATAAPTGPTTRGA